MLSCWALKRKAIRCLLCIFVFCIFVFLYWPLLESYFVFFKGMGGAACDRPSLRVQRDLRAELADDEKVAISNSAFL